MPTSDGPHCRRDITNAGRKLSAVKSQRNSRCTAHHADSLELSVVSGTVLLGVVAENSGTVEGTIILREVQPALEAVRALSSHAQPNDVR